MSAQQKKETKAPKAAKAPKEAKAAKAPKEAKAAKAPKEAKAAKAAKAPKDAKVVKPPKDPKAAKSQPKAPKVPKEAKGAKQPKVPKPHKDPKSAKAAKGPKKVKDVKGPKGAKVAQGAKKPLKAGKKTDASGKKVAAGGKKAKPVNKKVENLKKALAAKKAIKKGTKTRLKKKIRTSVIFHRPKTLVLPRDPKFPKKSLQSRNKLDQYAVIRSPVATESAMKKIEDHNTLVFYVDLKANKHHIKDAVRKLYQVKIVQVNTMVTGLGKKKAYVRLTSDYDAVEVANKIGVI
eukprot:TRINITY_DN128_c0_g1_i1.p1 TRINITY_DN128_c0_g1~~TRINITY_DN128_c0_g1_i1.p1  ORF type:complete len:291 (-),score=103.39 TRINITY_DN128_c0_g1_i1:54-926(-)